VSQPRGAHRAASTPEVSASPWSRLRAAVGARWQGRPRGRHAAPRRYAVRRGGTYAVAGLTTLGLAGALAWNGELPATAQVAALIPQVTASAQGAGGDSDGRADASRPPSVPVGSWLAARAREVQQAERSAAQAKAAAAAEAAAKALAAAQADPRGTARQLAADRGWTGAEFGCLETLWTKESHWSHTATNPSSGAYGIPQSLPAEKMATAGADWKVNPATQITWGLGYIKAAYGTPCRALNFHLGHNWY